MTIYDLLAGSWMWSAFAAFLCVAALSTIVQILSALRERYVARTKMEKEKFKIDHSKTLIEVANAEKERLEADAKATIANTAFIQYATENSIDINIASRNLREDGDWLKDSYENSDDPT